MTMEHHRAVVIPKIIGKGGSHNLDMDVVIGKPIKPHPSRQKIFTVDV